MAQGRVRWFNASKGFGFIETDSGKTVFVHISALEEDGLVTLKVGDRVSFGQTTGDRGPQATRVKKLYPSY